MKTEVHDPLTHRATLKLLRKWITESLEESYKLRKGFIFLGPYNFRGFIFWVRFCLVFIFLGIMKNVWAEPPIIYILEYTSWGLSALSEQYMFQN